MIDILAEEISMGKKQLSGPKIIFWNALMLLAIGPIISIISFSTGFFSMFAPGSFLDILRSFVFLIIGIV